MELTEDVICYIKENQREIRKLLLELAAIPSPSNHEEKRAAFCKKWLEKQGAEGVFIDDALNVIYPVGVERDIPLVVFMAHTDVVFPDTEAFSVTTEAGRIKAPGIGDDTANLCNLLFVAKYIAEKRIVPEHVGLLLVANAGEEGLGNLKGSRRICQEYGDRIQEFISFDLYMQDIYTDAVGSKRLKVEVTTEGGHSYGDFGNGNAIVYLASMIQELYQLVPPCSGKKTTYNVGIIQGGTSVNTIAQKAKMLYEYRSDSREDMEYMQKYFDSIIELYRHKGIVIQVNSVGERPCNGIFDRKKQKALEDRAARLIKKYAKFDPVRRPGSTDCNIPLSMGIPALCLGTICGGGAHTREEWIEEDSLEAGHCVAFGMILFYFANGVK